MINDRDLSLQNRDLPEQYTANDIKRILRSAMAKKIILICFIVISFTMLHAQTQMVSTAGSVTLENRKVSLAFDLGNGFYSVKNIPGDFTAVTNAYFQAEGLYSTDTTGIIEWSYEKINDVFGKGGSLHIRKKYRGYSDMVWSATLYDDLDFVVFKMGIINDSEIPFRLSAFYPLKSKSSCKGVDIRQNFAVLNGNSGGNKTYVSDTDRSICFNNVLIRFGDVKAPKIIVAGGLTYNEFEKYCKVFRYSDSLSIQLFSEDPVGKLIDPGSSWQGNELFYLCINNSNPFEALEKYGLAVRDAQRIKLNYYDFPTECLWYASVYAKDPARPKFNDSRGAVDEMDNAVKSGFTKYTRVAIRLVPDAYGKINQQGWWDDKHWAMWGDPSSTDSNNYCAPYLTTESWSRKIIEKGGLPLTYFQSGRRSEDFVKQFPQFMLFNDPYKMATGQVDIMKHLNYDLGGESADEYLNQWWDEENMVGYDFTDEGFINHMKDVYSDLKKAGIRGLMFDYPESTAWAFYGGFEDKHATTASAYRNMLRLAREGLGEDSYIDERMIGRGSDISLGLIASQRVWGDNDLFMPEMVTRCGLRWYKNRVVVNYDLDAKDPLKARPSYNNDGLKTLMTMCYVVSARFLMARGFYQLSEDQLFIMSRTFPYHELPKSARPIDAFSNRFNVPRIFDYEVNPDWHQLTLYNPNTDSTDYDADIMAVELGASLNEGGPGLNPDKEYFLYDFWNDKFIGRYYGSDLLIQELRLGETRMISIHSVEKNPQFISTNRHIMQGLVDMTSLPVWNDNKKVLSGKSEVIGGEEYKVVIALNGYKPAKCSVSNARASIVPDDEANDLAVLSIISSNNSEVEWNVSFRK
jgi:hypothetical protein